MAGPNPALPRVTMSLLDLPLTLELPKGVKWEYRALKKRHWRLTPYRHSRLRGEERKLDAVVSFYHYEVERWLRRLEVPVKPRAEARPGQRKLRLSHTKAWAVEHGAFPSRRALLLFRDMKASVALRVPPGAVLHADLALVPYAGGKQPVVLTVQVTPEGGAPVTLLEHHIGAKQAGWWEPVRVPLTRWAGQQVTLRFAARSAGAGRPTGALALGRPDLVHTATDRRPNLVVIVLDTVRADALSCYGQRRITTPVVDAIAREGTRFTRTYANASWTRPSLLSLVASRSPTAAGGTPSSFQRATDAVLYQHTGNLPTLFSRLAAHGYDTHGILNNMFMLPHLHMGGAHGLSSFAHVQWGFGPNRKDNKLITRAVDRYLAERKRRRFFLFVIFESVHHPYNPPLHIQALLKRTIPARPGRKPRRWLTTREMFFGEVLSLDEHTGHILRSLERHGLRDDTLVLITADHGEIFDERHCFQLPSLKSDTCHGHSSSVYQEVTHVPLILRGPGVPKGKVVTQVSQLLDVVPTTLDLLGLPKLPGAEGISLRPWIRGTAKDRPRDVFTAARGSTALLRWPFRLILRDARGSTIVQKGRRRYVRHELYDLRADPQEHHNVAPKHPERLARMLEALKGHAARDRVPPEYLRRILERDRWRKRQRRPRKRP